VQPDPLHCISPSLLPISQHDLPFPSSIIFSSSSPLSEIVRERSTES
jgi:hypothetical protein